MCHVVPNLDQQKLKQEDGFVFLVITNSCQMFRAFNCSSLWLVLSLYEYTVYLYKHDIESYVSLETIVVDSND